LVVGLSRSAASFWNVEAAITTSTADKDKASAHILKFYFGRHHEAGITVVPSYHTEYSLRPNSLAQTWTAGLTDKLPRHQAELLLSVRPEVKLQRLDTTRKASNLRSNPPQDLRHIQIYKTRDHYHFLPQLGTRSSGVMMASHLRGADEGQGLGQALKESFSKPLNNVSEEKKEKIVLTNKAGESRSPYVRAHASNPVAWQTWGDEAITLARKENKLLFVSIGYSACHCKLPISL
jgi:hypothetical protein